jgi:hypothetical protein
VDEAGTEAAAATAAMVNYCFTSSLPPPPVPFVADQPFLWALCGPVGDDYGGSGGGMPQLLFTGVFGGQGGEQSSPSYGSGISHTHYSSSPTF